MPDSARSLAVFAPPGGWERFALHDALSSAIWEGLSEVNDEWHYMNPASNFSVWESCKDGSAIMMIYGDAAEIRFEELSVVDAGCAEAHLAPIIARFGLVQVSGEGA